MTSNHKSPGINDPCAVLLVEDSPDDAYFFQRALRKSGMACELNHVLDGRAAVDYLRGASSGLAKMPDVIFLDLKMPVMSGFEFLIWVQKEPFAGVFPVIVLSGSDQESDRRYARELGATDYLVKPITPDNIAERLKGLGAADRCPARGTT
jgi:CheY-like chemotaxis protein